MHPPCTPTHCGLTTCLFKVDTMYSTYLLEVELDGARALEQGRPVPARQEMASRLRGRQCATLIESL